MTSESDPAGPDSVAPDPWRGDVADGVAAWTRGRAVPEPERADRPTRPGRSGTRSSSRQGGRQGGRRGSTSGGRSGSTGRGPSAERPPEPDADPEQTARTILLDQLVGRARSRRELADKLADKGVEDDVATRVLDRFTDVGLVDDAAFAATWVQQRQSGKGLARRALAQELRRKGVDDEVAREALDEVDPDQEREAARQLVRKKMRTLTRVDQTTATRRLVGMLARKGYGAGVAWSVVREELDADEDAFPEAPDDL